MTGKYWSELVCVLLTPTKQGEPKLWTVTAAALYYYIYIIHVSSDRWFTNLLFRKQYSRHPFFSILNTLIFKLRNPREQPFVGQTLVWRQYYVSGNCWLTSFWLRTDRCYSNDPSPKSRANADVKPTILF